MNNFAAALAAIERLKSEGVIEDYAIGGAMALIFWSEPIPTFDLDVFVLLPSDSPLISLAPIYEWARRNGYREEAEHILIAGMPVQVIPAHHELAEEAVASAAVLDFRGLAGSGHSSGVPHRAVSRTKCTHDQTARTSGRVAGRRKHGSRLARPTSEAL